MAKKTNIIPVTGISGCGKSSFLKSLVDFHRGDENGMVTGFSATSRRQRLSDINSEKKYQYVDTSMFLSMEKLGLFLESEKVHDDYYGTFSYCADLAKDLGRDLILDIDPKGALNLLKRKLAGEKRFFDFEVKPVFLYRKFSPLHYPYDEKDFEDSIRSILKKRGDDLPENKIQTRVETAKSEYALARENEDSFIFLENTENNALWTIDNFQKLITS